MCSSQIESDETLGLVSDLPYKRLTEGVSSLKLKDLVGRKGEIIYVLNKKISRDYADPDNKLKQYYYLEPVEIQSVTVTEPDGRWVRYTEYSVHGKSLTSGSNRFFGNRNSLASDAFFTEDDAAKIKANADALIEEKAFLADRSGQVDQSVKKEILSSIKYASKILQTNTFGNGEAKVSFGAYGQQGTDPVCVYIHVSPTDGPFMSSSLYETFYLPMTDGVVYRSYGAFSHATSASDWFLKGKGVVEITVDEMFTEIDELMDVYNSLQDGFDDSDLARKIHTIFR